MLTTHADSTAPADLLWARVADVESWPDHLETFTSITRAGGPEPIGTGSRFEVRQPGLPTSVYEVTEWTPGRSFTWAARSRAVTGTARHTVVPTDGGSRLELELEWTGPLAGLLRLLIGRKAQRMIELEATTFASLAATDAAHPERG